MAFYIHRAIQTHRNARWEAGRAGAKDAECVRAQKMRLLPVDCLSDPTSEDQPEKGPPISGFGDSNVADSGENLS